MERRVPRTGEPQDKFHGLGGAVPGESIARISMACAREEEKNLPEFKIESVRPAVDPLDC